MSSLARPIKLWRRILVYFLLLLILSCLQLSPLLWKSFPAPDFLFLLPLVVGLTRGGIEAFIVALISGFIRDYSCGRFYGLAMLFAMVIVLIASSLITEKKNIFWRRWFLLTITVSVVSQMLLALLTYFFPIDRRLPLDFVVILDHYGKSLIPKLIADLLGSFIIFLLLNLGFYRSKKRRQSSQTKTLWEN